MLLVEFIEALGRVSDKLSIPHLILERGRDLSDGNDNDREFYVKFEAYLIQLAKLCMSPSEFNQHIKALKKIIEEEK